MEDVLSQVNYSRTVIGGEKDWNWIASAFYQVIATLIGGIVASGGIGGFAIYMVGSVLANFAMQGVMNVIV